ncbi:hypothetical protein BH09BAC1_BH09BAC1_00970 [soil metagenome]
MTYDRDPKYLHPYMESRLSQITDAIQATLSTGVTCKFISAHRTPADQFELYKKGRTFKNGSWVKTGSVVTNIDGLSKKSMHNYLPCLAFDMGLFKDGKYLGNHPDYKKVAEGKAFNLKWGGDWTSLVDQPHLEMHAGVYFKSNLEKDNGYIWQLYLQKAGTYTGAMDGLFGPASIKALKAETGEAERNLKAWDKLYAKYGPLTV